MSLKIVIIIGSPLMWKTILHLHVNLNADDDDDDRKQYRP